MDITYYLEELKSIQNRLYNIFDITDDYVLGEIWFNLRKHIAELECTEKLNSRFGHYNTPTQL